MVTELADDGLLEEAGVVESDGGRPRTLLRVAPASGALIGVDVGETRVRVELFDLAMTELARSELPLTHHGYDVNLIVRHIADGIVTVLRESAVAPGSLLGVGVGVPGILDRGGPGGAVVHGQTIGWDAVPLEALLCEAVELPEGVGFFLSNGAKALGQAEMWFGGGRGAQDAAIVLLGSGVGACIVTDGGACDSAGEWGHLTVSVRGRLLPLRCPRLPGGVHRGRGAATALAGGGRPHCPRTPHEEAGVTALLAAACPPDDGTAADPVARSVLDETAEYLGAGISDLVNLFSPERVLIGGWAGLQLGPYLLPAVRAYATAYSLAHPMRPRHHRPRQSRPGRRHGRRGDTAAGGLLRQRGATRRPGPYTGGAGGRAGEGAAHRRGGRGAGEQRRSGAAREARARRTVTVPRPAAPPTGAPPAPRPQASSAA